MSFLSMLLSLLILASLGFGQILTVDDNEGVLDEPELVPSSLHKRRCNRKLGMESGDIHDDHISASSTVDGLTFGKEQARLNGDQAWVTYAIPEQWIQINLGKLMYVSGVQSQGKMLTRYGPGHWATAYKVLYKVYLKEPAWNAVSEGVGGGPVVFFANNDANSVVTNNFQEPVQAKVIRIVLMSWVQGSQRIALRLELLGCDIEAKSGCRSPRVMSNPKGFISSMNYPNNYDNNANCRWDITAPPGQTVILRFDDNFALEASPNHCRLEYVEVLDVIGNLDRSLGKFCGRARPGKFSSTDNRLKVRFMTDHYERYSGFKAGYEFVNGSGCGGPQILSDQSGTFQSMNYPQNYDDNAVCGWDIFADRDKLIKIRFNDMKIRRGYSDKCAGDNFQIINIGQSLHNRRSFVPMRYCGRELPSDFISASNQLRITFQSNGALTDKGFQVTYETIPASGCGGSRDLTDSKGTIQSLNYPNMYPKGLSCTWNIIAGSHHDVKITFLNFDLEEDSDCRYDHVSIYDGRSDRHLLGKYCNKLPIQPLVAHSGTMKVVFSSDMYETRSGFEASYVIIPRGKTLSTTSPQTSAYSTTTEIATTAHRQTDVGITNIDYFTDKHTARAMQKNFTTSVATPATMFQETDRTVSTTKKTSGGHVPPVIEPHNPVLTEATAKWILVGMAAVGGLLIALVLFGLFLCCWKHCSNSNTSIHGSIRNGSSGAMQNRAYDFSVGSNNQSIRSRQDLPESSQMSDSFSHQGTLTHAPSRDSHIYFSIDEYCGNKKKQDSTPAHSGNDAANLKVHYKKNQGNHCNESEASVTTVHSDEEYSEEDEDGCIIANVDSETEQCINYATTSKRPSRCDNTEANSQPTSRKTSLCATTKEAPKIMVDNILYESTESGE